MDQKVDKYFRTALTWNELTHAAHKREVIQYGDLADRIGLSHVRPLRHYLKILQTYCIDNKLPPLTILATDTLGTPGQGFIAWDSDNIDEGKNTVYGYNWKNLRNPFGFAMEGLTENEIINSLLSRPANSQDIYSKIKVRGTAQSIFRKALLIAYGKKCAICEIHYDFLLEACHITPWSKAKKTERLDIRNGILLCANHHKLFDNGYFTINDDYSICIEYEKIAEGQHLGLNIGKLIHLPRNKELWPKKKHLSNHRIRKGQE
ncbi:HNH endonuclease [Flagellimonas baculiformis]|uniref:HNH endonuclease n=1 Tax=Flagellimonas baculiformis TaxID=3067310 RepID=UPI00296F9684|nr:HNH endonuclease signature motif containing protein [Muricauda sp. D6]